MANNPENAKRNVKRKREEDIIEDVEVKVDIQKELQAECAKQEKNYRSIYLADPRVAKLSAAREVEKQLCQLLQKAKEHTKKCQKDKQKALEEYEDRCHDLPWAEAYE